MQHMRHAWSGVSVTVGVLALSLSSAPLDAQAPAAGSQPGARGGRDGAAGNQGGARAGRAGRGGRGAAPAGPSKPTPRWPDGRVNLSQVPGVKGFWNNMSGSPIGGSLPGNLTLEQVPFQDWARALYEYRRTRGGLEIGRASC